MTRVVVVGTGLIGASIGLGLRRAGVTVVGVDRDPARAEHALARGALDAVAPGLPEAVSQADVVVVAVPVDAVADVVVAALDAGAATVTDVASVKAPIVAAVQAARPERAARFVAGHPMAGSEQDGPAGAHPDLFLAATWVLTPTEGTDPDAFRAVRSLVGTLGAEVVAVAPEHHDTLAAVVSHVPHLAAGTLMDVAAGGGEQHATMLRLAAGGFRDMTRIASGDPHIWPDICVANRDAIVAGLDEYLEALGAARDLVATGDRAGIRALLERARAARRSLPMGTGTDEALVEMRVPVPDRPGVLAEVTTLAGGLGINIADFEIAHSVEGGRGVLVMVVGESSRVGDLETALSERGYHPSHTRLA